MDRRVAMREALRRAGLPCTDADVDTALERVDNCQQVLPLILRRQTVRAWRISGRSTGFTDGMPRPSDRDFLLEAAVPRPKG